MGRVFCLLVGLSVLTTILAAPKRNKKKDDEDDDMSELNLVDYGGNSGGGQNVYGGTKTSTGGTGSYSPSVSVDFGTTTPSTPPSTRPPSTPRSTSNSGGIGGTAPSATTGEDSPTLIPVTSSAAPRTACWLQLQNGQWIWNTYHRDYNGQLRCGGWVRLPNCQWHWTDQPRNYYPVVCYDMFLQHGGSSGGDGDGGDGDGGDGDGGDGGEGSTDGPTNVSTEGNAGNSGGNNGGGNSGEGNGGNGGDGGDGGNGGDGGGGVSGGACSCSEWDFPGECGTDGMIFRWRTCEPRYCDVEDEYVPCP